MFSVGEMPQHLNSQDNDIERNKKALGLTGALLRLYLAIMKPRFTIASLFVATAYSAVFVAAYRYSTFVSFWLAFVAALSLIYFAIRAGLRSSGPVRTFLLTFACIATLALIRPLLERHPFLGTWMVGSMIGVDGIFTWTAAAHLGVLLMLEWLVGAAIVAGLAAGSHRSLMLLRK